MHPRKGESAVRNVDSGISETMGGSWGRCRNKYNDRGSKITVQRKTSFINKSTCKQSNFRENSRGLTRVHSKVVGYRGNKRDHKANTTSFFYSLHETEKEWEKTSHNRSFGTKQNALFSEFQNGDGCSNFKHDNRGVVGVFNRHQRRLLSCPDKLGISQIPGLQSQEQGVRIPVSSVWSVPSSLGLHKGDQASKEETALIGSDNFQFHRRLHPVCEVAGGVKKSNRNSLATTSEIGIQHQLGEIQPSTFTECRISRSRLGSTGSDSVRSFGEKAGDCQALLDGSKRGVYDSQGNRVSGGEDELRIGLHPTREDALTSSSGLDESANISFFQGSLSPIGCTIQETPDALVGLGVSGESGVTEAGSSKSNPNDRCVVRRLVRGSTSPQDGGFLESGLDSSFHELEGINGGVHVPAELQISFEGEKHPSALRQHNNSQLSEEAGHSSGANATFPVYGDSGVLQGELHHNRSSSHKWGDECLGGPGIQGVAGSGGMVLGQTVVQVDRERDAQVANRPVRDSFKRSASKVHVPLSRPESSRVRRVMSRLEQVELHISVPTNSSSSTSSGETSGLCRFGSTSGSFLGDTRVVSLNDDEVQNETFSAAQRTFSQSVDFEGFGVHGERDQTILEPTRLGAIKQGMGEGCSRDTLDIVDSAHRDSTVRQYQAIWSKFLEYVDYNNISHDAINLDVVMNFLSHQFLHLKRQYRTIAAYKCALEIPLKANFGIEFNRFELHLFMRGVFNHRPPQKSRPLPDWSLNTLLNYINSDIFEPLGNKALEFLEKKLLCLILLATGRRISEVGGLSMKHTPFNQGKSLQLFWIKNFKPKHYTAKFVPNHPIIDYIDSDAEEDLKLCPARAFNMYVHKINNGSRHSVNSPLWMRDILELTALFRNIVADSVRFANVRNEDSVGPHQMRKFAASYSALLLDADPALERRLFGRMGCSSMNVLRKHYIKEVPPLNFKCVLPIGTFSPSN